VSGYRPKTRVYEMTWTNATYWHRPHRGPPCALCRVKEEGLAHVVGPLERAGFKVLRVEDAYVVIDMPDEPFKPRDGGLTTRESLRLRRVMEQPATAGEGG
jgi:hypothetical protein